MRIGAVRKLPEDRQDYDITYADYLPEGDTLTDIEVSIDGDAPALVVDSASIDGVVAKVWLSGGEAGISYDVEVRVTTAQGRIKTACFDVRVVNC